MAVVSRDLAWRVLPGPVAPTLQSCLDDWINAAPLLEESARVIEVDPAADLNAHRFDQSAAESPLPRAYQWADGSAYINHVELVRRARGAPMPERFFEEPLMYQGGSDSFLGPRDDIEAESEELGIDFEAEIAVIVGDTPRGVGPDQAGKYIKLFMLANDVTYRNVTGPELAKGFGFFHSKPSTAFSPVAVTPDELGNARGGRSYSCLAEQRMVETIEDGEPSTPVLRFGDNVRIWMEETSGQSIFGAIDQTVRKIGEQ